MNFRLDHISLQVHDIDASTAFYVRAFGWPIVRTSGEPVTGRWLGIGGTDTLHLNVRDPFDTRLTKDNHFALSVDNFDAVLADLTTKGITYVDWPGAPLTIGYHAAGFRQVYVQDPDGYWVEINDNGQS